VQRQQELQKQERCDEPVGPSQRWAHHARIILVTTA
jgi:hypothetical protein